MGRLDGHLVDDDSRHGRRGGGNHHRGRRLFVVLLQRLGRLAHQSVLLDYLDGHVDDGGQDLLHDRFDVQARPRPLICARKTVHCFGILARLQVWGLHRSGLKFLRRDFRAGHIHLPNGVGGHRHKHETAQLWWICARTCVSWPLSLWRSLFMWFFRRLELYISIVTNLINIYLFILYKIDRLYIILLSRKLFTHTYYLIKYFLIFINISVSKHKFWNFEHIHLDFSIKVFVYVSITILCMYFRIKFLKKLSF